jgi:hypothetical protein
MNDETLHALEVILRSDRRPWRTVTREDDELAELHFPGKLRAEAEAIAEQARELGFEVEVRDGALIQESVTSAGLDVILLVIKGVIYGGAALIAVNSAVKAANELPDGIRKLREKIRPYLSRAAQLAPGLQLDPVNRWLDDRYGAKQWMYDPDKVEVKQIAEVTVFYIKEERSGTMLLLAVEGDDVRELALNLLPERTT